MDLIEKFIQSATVKSVISSILLSIEENGLEYTLDEIKKCSGVKEERILKEVRGKSKELIAGMLKTAEMFKV